MKSKWALIVILQQKWSQCWYEQNRKLRTIWRPVWFEEDNHIPFIWVSLQIVTCCSYSSMSGKPSGEIRSRFTNTPLSKCLRCLLFIFRVILCACEKLSCPNWETEGAVCEEGVAWPDRKHNLVLTSERFEGPPSVTLLSHKGHWRDPWGFCLILDPEKTRDIPR